jgi:hypothetical protein
MVFKTELFTCLLNNSLKKYMVLKNTVILSQNFKYTLFPDTP